MTRKTISLIVCMAGIASADSYGTLLQRYERQIHRQEKQLGDLRDRLVEKEKESVQWQQKADQAKSEWSQAGAVVEKTRAAVQGVRSDLQKTKVLADAAEGSMTERLLLSHSADEQLAMLTKQIYEDRVSAPSADPEQSVLPTYVLDRMCGFAGDIRGQAKEAQIRETALRTEEMQLQTSESRQSAELDRLHEKQQAQWRRWQEANRRTEELRDEKAQMEQSAEALRVMVEELRDHRQHAIAARQGKTADDGAIASLRGTLPWPAEGEVTQNFGRQYSTELQQLQISNGIKIDSGAGHSVRAIDGGKVLFARTFRDYGRLVIVEHKRGLTSVYGSLGVTRVKEGDLVRPMDIIGTTDDHGSFYFELRHDEQPVNPLVYLVPSHRSDLSSRRKYP